MVFSPETFLDDKILFLSSPFGFLVFTLFYTLWVICLLPASWLTMLAGLIYGSLLGSLLVFLGAVLGAQITFILGRTWLRNWAQKKLSYFPKFKVIETAVNREGLKLIFLTRLSPVFPFSLLNLLYGISTVKPVDFLIGLLGILPGTILYCSFGELAGKISRFNQVLSGREDIASFVFSMVSIGATILVFWILTNSIRDVLQEKNEGFFG